VIPEGQVGTGADLALVKKTGVWHAFFQGFPPKPVPETVDLFQAFDSFSANVY
jgi:hypothetical protein